MVGEGSVRSDREWMGDSGSRDLMARKCPTNQQGSNYKYTLYE